jgi:hypothetical protein
MRCSSLLLFSSKLKHVPQLISSLAQNPSPETSNKKKYTYSSGFTRTWLKKVQTIGAATS